MPIAGSSPCSWHGAGVVRASPGSGSHFKGLHGTTKRSAADLSARPWEGHLQGKHHFPLSSRVFHFYPIPTQGKGQACAGEESLIPSRRLSAKGMGCKSAFFAGAVLGFMFSAEEVNALPTHNRESVAFISNPVPPHTHPGMTNQRL